MQGWPQKHYHPFCGHGFFGGRALLLDVLKIDLCLVFHVVHWHAIKDRGWWIDCGENRKEMVTLVFVGEKVVMCLEKCCLVSTYSSPAIGTSLQSHLFVCTKAYPWLGGVPTLQTDVPPGQWRSPRLLGRLVLRWWWADGGTWCTCRRIASGFAKAVGVGRGSCQQCICPMPFSFWSDAPSQAFGSAIGVWCTGLMKIKYVGKMGLIWLCIRLTFLEKGIRTGDLFDWIRSLPPFVFSLSPFIFEKQLVVCILLEFINESMKHNLPL